MVLCYVVQRDVVLRYAVLLYLVLVWCCVVFGLHFGVLGGDVFISWFPLPHGTVEDIVDNTI